MRSKRLPTWREMNADTSPEAEAILFKLLRETPAWRKLEMMGHLNQTALQLALAGLQEQFPQADEATLHRHLADRLLGNELAQIVYGPHPKASSSETVV